MIKCELSVVGKDIILSEHRENLTVTYFDDGAIERGNLVLKNAKVKDGKCISDINGKKVEIIDYFEFRRILRKVTREREVRKQKRVLVGSAAVVVLGTVLIGTLGHKDKTKLDNETRIEMENPAEQVSEEEALKAIEAYKERQALEAKVREIDKKLSDDMWRQAKIDSMPKEEDKAFEVRLSDTIDILPVGDTKNVIIEIDGVPNNYDEVLDIKVDRYANIIKDAAERVGLPEGIIKDPIKHESSGGDDSNIMQVEVNAWLDQEISCYDYKEQRFTSYVLTEHPENHQRIKNIITPEMLNDPRININFGANALKWCIVNSRNNLPVGVTLYNGGWYQVMEKTIPNTAKALGITTNEVLDNESDLTFLNYIDYPEGWGDEEYFLHVMGKATDGDTFDYSGYTYIDRSGNKCTKNYHINLNKVKQY